ncbi:MAG: hypothetical protein IKI93_09560, partial [Clostridia bacterium]|nr:hypothetical protein [Clostridia bacterium]
MENKKIWACLCHLGYNMWADYEEKDGVKGFYYGQDSDVIATPRLRFQREAWDRILEMLKDAGCNMIVLDIGEGVRGNLLRRKQIALIFEKSSTRTRNSSQIAARD